MAAWKSAAPWGGVAAGLACAFALAVDGCTSDRFDATTDPIDADASEDAYVPDEPAPEAGSADGGAGAFCSQQTNIFFCEDFEGSDFPSQAWNASDGGPGSLVPGLASGNALRLALSAADQRRIGLSRTFLLPNGFRELRLDVNVRAVDAPSLGMMIEVVSLHLGGDAGSFGLEANTSDPGGGRVFAGKRVDVGSGVTFIPDNALPPGVWQTYRFVVNRPQNTSTVELFIDGVPAAADGGRRPAIAYVGDDPKTLALELEGSGSFAVDLDNIVIQVR